MSVLRVVVEPVSSLSDRRVLDARVRSTVMNVSAKFSRPRHVLCLSLLIPSRRGRASAMRSRRTEC